MTRYISGEIKEPVVSVRKQPRPAYIPPFSFVGEIEPGISGYWYPQAAMELHTASISASTPGITNGSFNVLKQEPGVPDPLVIGSFLLGATQKKAVVSLNDTYVTPYDKIFIVAWVASGHQNVVVQIVGSMMT